MGVMVLKILFLKCLVRECLFGNSATTFTARDETVGQVSWRKSLCASLLAPVSCLWALFVNSNSLLFLQVDERMNGDGVGYPLGISDPTFFWVIFGVFTLVWTLFYTSNIGGGESDDDGLSL